MRVISRLLPFVALIAFTAWPVPVHAAARAEGHWEGKIQIPDHELRIAVDLAQTATGAWVGSLSIAGSSATDVPLIKITVSSEGVQFTASLPGETSFVGTLSTDASSLAGKVSNAEGAVPFQLARTGEANVKLPPPSSPSSKEFEGEWQGTVDVGGKVMRLVLKVSAAPDGTAKATVTNLDKGNVEIPATTVTIQGRQLELQMRVIGGSYRGTLGSGGEIAGELAQQSVKMPVTFTRVASPPQPLK